MCKRPGRLVSTLLCTADHEASPNAHGWRRQRDHLAHHDEEGSTRPLRLELRRRRRGHQQKTAEGGAVAAGPLESTTRPGAGRNSTHPQSRPTWPNGREPSATHGATMGSRHRSSAHCANILRRSWQMPSTAGPPATTCCPQHGGQPGSQCDRRAAQSAR